MAVVTVTQSEVTLAINVNTVLVAANVGRRGLVIQSQGDGDVRLTFDGSAPSKTHGLLLKSGETAGGMGGVRGAGNGVDFFEDEVRAMFFGGHNADTDAIVIEVLEME